MTFIKSWLKKVKTFFVKNLRNPGDILKIFRNGLVRLRNLSSEKKGNMYQKKPTSKKTSVSYKPLLSVVCGCMMTLPDASFMNKTARTKIAM